MKEIQGFWTPGITIVEAAEGEEPRRQLVGTVVPFSSKAGEHVGNTSIGPVRFLAGSLDASERPAVDRDHDRTRLVGKVIDASADDVSLVATVKLSTTALGEETLVLAAEEVTTGFSITAHPIEFSYEDDDEYGQVAVIAKAKWVGLAVTPDPAYDTARISKVAAQRVDPVPEEGKKHMNMDTFVALLVAASEERRSELIGNHAEMLSEQGVTAADVRLLVQGRLDEIEAARKPQPADVASLAEVAAALPEEERPQFVAVHRDAIEAAGVTGPSFDALVGRADERNTPPPQPVNISADGVAYTKPRMIPLAEWITLDACVQAANKGVSKFSDPGALARMEALHRQYSPIEAALDTTTSVLTVGIVPPFYTDEVLNGLTVHTPLLDNCVRRAALPATGMSIIKPAWTVLPEGDWYTTENTEPASDAIAIGTRTVSVLSWAHAVRASINSVERSTFGGLAQNYYTQATISYLSDKEARIAEEMMDAVVLHNGLVNTTAETTVKAKIGALVTAVINQQDDANDNFRGLTPNFAALATDVYEDLSTVDTDAGVAFGSGNAEVGGLMGRLGTLNVYLVPCLDAGGIIVGSSMATEVRDGNELQLRDLIVNTMSYELGVHANCSIDVEYPNALAANTDAFS